MAMNDNLAPQSCKGSVGQSNSANQATKSGPTSGTSLSSGDMGKSGPATKAGVK